MPTHIPRTRTESESMKEQESIATLTTEVLARHSEVSELGRKSVPLIIECGKKLTAIQDSLANGKWTDWTTEHQDRISVSTVNRYQRVYKLSLVTSLEGKTLTEVYEMLKSKKKKPTESPSTDDTANKEPEDLTPLEALEELVTEVIDTVDRLIPESERPAALKTVYAIVEFYNDRMEGKVTA